MVITKNNNSKVSENFTMSEIYKASGGQGESFVFSDVCINAVQYIRSYFKEPITITSTRRSKEYNKSIGGSSRSQHITGNAIDWKFTNNTDEKHELLYREFISGGDLLRSILGLGIYGIGIYKRSNSSGIFCHFDDGKSPYNKRSKLTAWDNRNVLDWGNIRFDTTFVTNLRLTPKEDLPVKSKYDLFIDRLKSMDNDEIFKTIMK